jgi:hypothetical protein
MADPNPVGDSPYPKQLKPSKLFRSAWAGGVVVKANGPPGARFLLTYAAQCANPLRKTPLRTPRPRQD